MRIELLWIIALGCLGLVGVVPAVQAKEWKGAVPGKTTRGEVLKLFGQPTRLYSKGGKLSDGVTYQGSQAIEGAQEANFYFDKNSSLFRIDVFPKRAISHEDVLRIFGPDFRERVTKEGNPCLDYFREGMVVFFDKDQPTKVVSFTFSAPPGTKSPGS